MKQTRLIIAAALVLSMGAGTAACGGGAAKGGEAAEAEGTQTELTDGPEQAGAATEGQKAEDVKAKKWWEQDFELTYKMYVMSKSLTRTYARKGNIVVSRQEGSQAQNLYIFTDSTRTNYLVNPDKGRYGKVGVKSGFSGVDEGVKKFLKDQLGDDFFKKILSKGDEGVEAKDTTVFGRAAYVLTKEATEKNPAVEIYGKTIQWVDKENGLIYYKYALVKNGDQVISDGKTIEVTAFSAEPAYEGLKMSLEGMEDVSN